MKSLQEFIIEQAEVNEAAESKTVTLDFTDLENAEDKLKSFEDKEYCSVDDNKLTVTVTKENADKLGSIKDELKEYSDTLRGSSKRSSDEQYAQKTVKFEEQVKSLDDAIAEVSADDEDKKDDKKEEE